jgi:hypothetical protein
MLSESSNKMPSRLLEWRIHIKTRRVHEKYRMTLLCYLRLTTTDGSRHKWHSRSFADPNNPTSRIEFPIIRLTSTLDFLWYVSPLLHFFVGFPQARLVSTMSFLCSTLTFQQTLHLRSLPSCGLNPHPDIVGLFTSILFRPHKFTDSGK